MTDQHSNPLFALYVAAACMLVLFLLHAAFPGNWVMYYPFLLAALAFLVAILYQRNPFQRWTNAIIPTIAAIGAIAFGFFMHEDFGTTFGVFSSLSMLAVFLILRTTPRVKLPAARYVEITYASLVTALFAFWGTSDFVVTFAVFALTATSLYRGFAAKYASAH